MTTEAKATPRKSEHKELVHLYDAGRLSAVRVLEFWTPAWDAARRREKAGAQ